MMSAGPQPVRPPADEEWSALKDAVHRFEDAWRQGARPAIDDYLPPGDGRRHRLLVELAHIELELRLKAGEAARVEEYLARYPELAGDRAAALGLVVVEYELRRRREPGLGLDDYVQRFPQYRAELPEQVARPTVAGGDTPPPPADPGREAPPQGARDPGPGPPGRRRLGGAYDARPPPLDPPPRPK